MSHLFKDIALEAGVSPATVSRVFNNSGYVSSEKRSAVLAAASKIGYSHVETDKNFEKMSRDIIGVVIPDIMNPFFSEVIKGINQVARANKINVLICDTDESPDQEIQSLQTLRREKVGGIIITPTSEVIEYNAEYLKELNSLGIPIVLLDRDVKLSSYDGVFLDSVKGSFDAVKELIECGHTEIAIIAGTITTKPGIDRLKGYLEALRLYNIPIKEDYIFYGNFKLENAYELATRLLDTKKEVTAIFSSNNLMSVGCLQAILDRDLSIPEDIALVSFDDFYLFGSKGINITAVTRPTREMGIEAATILVEKMRKGKKYKDQVTKRIILSPHLVIRGSEKYPVNRKN